MKWSEIKWSDVKWSEVNEAKWGGMRWSEVQYREGGLVFMEKVYRSSKWWEVKDWGQSVSELMNEKKQLQETVLSYLGIFTFCTCCILICLLFIVASFKLSLCNCCWLAVCIVVVVLCVCVVILCVFFVLCGHCCFLLYIPDCWLEVSIRKVLRTATSTQVFLRFPVSISKCWDASQDSKLPLHASHVALPT